MDELSSFAAILFLASISALVLRRFKIAPVAAYIIAGLVVGPILGIVNPNSRSVEFLSEIGIALMSFQIGLSVRADFLKSHGPRILMTSILELIFVVFLSSVFGIVASMSMAATFVIILIAVNSSTIIAFKLLEGRGMTRSPLFTLIVGLGMGEDITVMVGISLIPALATLGRLMIGEAFSIVGNTIAIVLVMFVFGMQILPKLIRYVMRHGDIETLLLIILALALGYGLVGGYMGLSFALGSFLAGAIVSRIESEMPPVAMERLTSLRDLFAIIFFISIGLSMPYIQSPSLILTGLGLALVMIIIKSTSATLASWIGMGMKDALRIGLYMIPISELALIVAREAYKFGLVDQNIFISSAFAVLSSVILASRLVEKDTVITERVASFVPLSFQKFMERIAANTKTLLEKVVVSKECRPIILSLSKKLASMVAVLTLGSIILQNLTTVDSGFTYIFEVVVISVLLAFSFTMILMSRRDVERLMSWYVNSFRARKGTGDLIKNSFYILTFSFLGVVILLNGTSILRGILSNYFEVGVASALVFLIIISFTAFVIYILYGKMKGILEAMESSLGAFSRLISLTLPSAIMKDRFLLQF
ncbi:MAG: cation:proton antiporter [Candidatus Methanomethyliaceae archaeon]|nr:cation:proton antiporter [Candidatus Methanomethyliaceae archaeon]